VKRFLEMPGNREGKKRKEESNPSPALQNPCKGHRQFPSFVDSITKKQVVQIFELTQSGFGTAGAVVGALAGFFHGRYLQLNKDLPVAARSSAKPN
jgi:hypothetical protein